MPLCDYAQQNPYTTKNLTEKYFTVTNIGIIINVTQKTLSLDDRERKVQFNEF
jgi:hypothetical protein